jgi:hypothetical protein
MTFLTPLTYWGLAAGVAAVSAEYLFRRLPGSWLDYWWVFAPLALAINYCVCQMVRQPSINLIDAFIVFALSTTVTRVCVSLFILEEVVKAGTWTALFLLLTARVVQLYWR